MTEGALKPIVALFLAALVVGPVANAADPAVANAVNVLLNKGWAKTAEAKGLATHATLDRPPLSADSSVLEARWLVLMYQGQYAPAMDSLKRHLEKSPTSLEGLRAEVWIGMVQQEHVKALAAAQRLADVVLPAQQGSAKVPADSAASEELIQLLGRVSGVPGRTSEQGQRPGPAEVRGAAHHAAVPGPKAAIRRGETGRADAVSRDAGSGR